MELPDFYPRPGGTSESMPNLQDPLESQIFRSDVFSNFPFGRPCRAILCFWVQPAAMCQEGIFVSIMTEFVCGYVLNPCPPHPT
jgi:hypothetical protein